MENKSPVKQVVYFTGQMFKTNSVVCGRKDCKRTFLSLRERVVFSDDSVAT